MNLADQTTSRSSQRGVVMAAVLFVLLGLTVMGATAIFSASADVEIAGNMRRAHQQQVCAKGASDNGVSRLPETAIPGSMKLSDEMYAQIGHLALGSSGPASISTLGGLQAAGLASGAGKSITNNFMESGGGAPTSGGTLSVTQRQPVRIVGYCSPSGGSGAVGSAEREQILLYGLEQ